MRLQLELRWPNILGKASLGLICFNIRWKRSKDWWVQGLALRSCVLVRRRRVSKFVSGWCATGKMMHRWDKRIVASCPRCNCPIENVDHVLNCPAEGATAMWDCSITKVQEWLGSNQNSPDFSILVLNALSSFRSQAKWFSYMRK